MSGILLENTHNSTYITYNNVYNIVEVEETTDLNIESIFTDQKLKLFDRRSISDKLDENKVLKIVKLSNSETYTEISYSREFVDMVINNLNSKNKLLIQENENLVQDAYHRGIIMDKYRYLINQSLPTHAVVFLILNILIAFISFILILLSITTENFNLNIITLLYIIVGNIVLIFTSLGSISDWRKKIIEDK